MWHAQIAFPFAEHSLTWEESHAVTGVVFLFKAGMVVGNPGLSARQSNGLL